MSWAKIDDLLPHHRKLVLAGARAPIVYGYYVASINFCRRHLTDGRVTPADFPLIFPSYPRPAGWLIAELERVHFWDPQPDGAWSVHDYLEHNDDAEVVKAKRRADSARKRRSPPSGFQSDSERIPNVASPYPKNRRESPSGIQTESDELSLSRTGSAGPEPVANILARLAEVHR